MLKLSKNIIPLIVVVVVGCSKTEVLEHPSYLNIIEDSLYFNYPQGVGSIYYMVEYEATPLLRIIWTSPDSFVSSIIEGKIEKIPIVNYSTYTRENGTGKQNIFIDSSFIGDTLEIYARGNKQIDKLLIIVK